MRTFNTAGPIVAEDHYHIPPLARTDLDEVLGLVRRKKYSTLYAPRQTGKTSTLLALRDLLNEQGCHCVYATVETARTARKDEVAWYVDAGGRPRHLQAACLPPKLPPPPFGALAQPLRPSDDSAAALAAGVCAAGSTQRRAHSERVRLGLRPRDSADRLTAGDAQPRINGGVQDTSRRQKLGKPERRRDGANRCLYSQKRPGVRGISRYSTNARGGVGTISCSTGNDETTTEERRCRRSLGQVRVVI